ncbi:MAG: FAD-dependent oxidoreductase, partial [Acidobacteriota bacterium]
LKGRPRIRLAGQITGVEGYLESAATGLMAAIYTVLERSGTSFVPVPASTALGALARHLTESDPKRFQPANINYGLFEGLGEKLPKRKRRAAYVERARNDLETWAASHKIDLEAVACETSSPVTSSI